MFFVFVLGIVSINPCTMHFPDHFWLDLIIPYHIILIKIPTLGKHSFKKNEVLNARVYWTDDITENFVTECLIKVTTFLNQCEEKGPLDGWIQFTKNTYVV